jgi:hypothetical protein
MFNQGRIIIMKIPQCAVRTAVIGAAALGLSSVYAPSAVAQSAACVNLLSGAGYSAWMGVKFGDSFYWSSSFPVGQTRCVALPVAGMVNGAPYTVVISAALGSSKVQCNQPPSPWISTDTNSVVYNAWGTSLNVSCQMPQADSSSVSVAPTPEGLAALEKWKKEGPKPHP